MDPNRAHAVWTLEHAICSGGHFIPTATLEKTAFGLIHTFFRGDVITNAEHPEIWPLLQRQLIYYHKAFFRQRITAEGA